MASYPVNLSSDKGASTNPNAIPPRNTSARLDRTHPSRLKNHRKPVHESAMCALTNNNLSGLLREKEDIDDNAAATAEIVKIG